MKNMMDKKIICIIGLITECKVRLKNKYKIKL